MTTSKSQSKLAVAFNYTAEDFLRSDTMLKGKALDYAHQIQSGSMDYLNGGNNLMKVFMVGYIEGGVDFKRAFLEIYTNASNFDDNGEAIKRLKNLIDRSMKRIKAPVTVIKNRKTGKFVWGKPVARTASTGDKPYSKGMHTIALVLKKQGKTNRLRNVANMMAEAGLDLSDIASIADELQAILTAGDDA